MHSYAVTFGFYVLANNENDAVQVALRYIGEEGVELDDLHSVKLIEDKDLDDALGG